MNEMQVFKYGYNEVRTVEQGGEVWWVLADVCRVLGLSEPHRVAHRLDEDEKGRTQITTLGGDQKMTIISESGLYKVILRSDKPEAKKFTRWVTHEVLPTIRRTGSYSQPGAQTFTIEQMTQFAAAVASQVAMQIAPVIATTVEKILDQRENQWGANDRAWATNYHTGPRKQSVVRPPKSGGTLRMETFPPEVLSAVNDMMEQMVEEQTLNFSAIARYCTGEGCFISSPSVRRYYDKHYNQH